MGSKILLDANILIDFLLERESFEISERLLKVILYHPYKAFVTPAIIHITSHWVKKSLGIETTKTLLLELLKDIKTIDCDHKTAVLAINSSMNDVEDALQYYTALHHKLDYIITLDKHFQKQAIPSLPIYSPQDFLKIFID